MKIKSRNYYAPCFILSCIITIFLYAILLNRLFPNQLLTIISMIGAFYAFLYSQNRQQTQLFKELFTEFNLRYNNMNDSLTEIIRKLKNNKKNLSHKDYKILIDYINLCAEEYLYYSAGYIDENVWNTWLEGMKYYFNYPDIRKILINELETNNYYGFNTKILIRA
jgi:hypothetical protein